MPPTVWATATVPATLFLVCYILIAFKRVPYDDAGVGSISDGEMRVYDYSAQELLVFDDANYPVYDGHPRMPGLVYVDKHVQVCLAPSPSHDIPSQARYLRSPAKTPA
jgi:hypothetical protein